MRSPTDFSLAFLPFYFVLLEKRAHTARGRGELREEFEDAEVEVVPRGEGKETREEP